jgi:hypothetical protein
VATVALVAAWLVKILDVPSHFDAHHPPRPLTTQSRWDTARQPTSNRTPAEARPIHQVYRQFLTIEIPHNGPPRVASELKPCSPARILFSSQLISHPTNETQGEANLLLNPSAKTLRKHRRSLAYLEQSSMPHNPVDLESLAHRSDDQHLEDGAVASFVAWCSSQQV